MATIDTLEKECVQFSNALTLGNVSLYWKATCVSGMVQKLD